MTSVLASAGMLFSLGAGALRDTMIVKQVPVERGLLEQITSVATIVMTVALLGLTVIAIPLAGHFRRAYRKIDHLLDRVYGDVTPIVRNAHEISDNINFVTTSVRADVAKLNAAIDVASERVQQAMAMTERRVAEFNALLAVAQEEAEDVFVSTASAVRGVRQGAAAFRERGGMDLASDELDSADSAGDSALQEDGDGHDSSTQPTAETLPSAPRVRPRPGSRRRA